MPTKSGISTSSNAKLWLYVSHFYVRSQIKICNTEKKITGTWCRLPLL